MRVVVARERQEPHPRLICRCVRNNYRKKFNEEFIDDTLLPLMAVGDKLTIEEHHKYYNELLRVAPDLTDDIEVLSDVVSSLLSNIETIIKDTSRDLRNLRLPNIEKIIRQEIKHRL